MPPYNESASNHALNSKGSRLTIYVVNATKRWISKLQSIKFLRIQTYALSCQCHRKMNHWATMHWILRGPDLHTTLWIPPKNESASDYASNYKISRLTRYIVDATERWISEQPCIEFQEIQTYILHCRWHRKTNKWETRHQIPRDPDLHPMLSMAPKDESASDNASNSERSRLTYYVVNGTKKWISEQPCIGF